MGLTRLSSKGGRIIIEEDSESTTLSLTDMTRVDTSTKLRDEANAKRVAPLKKPIFYHKNRNGTLAVAYGEAPAVWPEDEGKP